MLATVLAILACELGFRWKVGLGPDRSRLRAEQDVPTIHHGVAPYTMYNRFEYGAPLPPRRPGEIRIFMTGGSTVELGDPPLPDLLEREFHGHGKLNVRVFNYGVISYKSGQELAQIIFNITPQFPDAVVMYNGGNDTVDSLVWDPRPGYPWAFTAIESNPLLRPVASYPLVPLVFYGSAIARHLFPKYFAMRLFYDSDHMDVVRKKVGYGTDSWRKDLAEIYTDNVATAETVCRAFDAKFFSFYQPLVYFKQPRHPRELNAPEAEDHAVRVRGKILENMKLRAAQGLKFVDLSDMFDEVPDRVFEDDIHLLQKYNEAVARRIYQRIEADLSGPNRGAGPHP